MANAAMMDSIRKQISSFEFSCALEKSGLLIQAVI
jgi:hypothetical protein